MYQRVTTVVFCVLVFAVAGWAQQDPRMGTWKLNLAKSKDDPGPPPRSVTLKFEPSGANGEKYTGDSVNAQGNATHSEYTANYDGKDYPIKGSQTADTVSLIRIDPYTRVRIDKKGGNVVSMLSSVVSKDGRTFTSASFGVNAQGKAYHNVRVYEKQ